jgi:hypothetical protein
MFGQHFNFVGHHGKALAGFAGVGSLDGCIQRQQVLIETLLLSLDAVWIYI